MEYFTISRLIKDLEEYKSRYGDLPVLIAIQDEETDEFSPNITPMSSDCVMGLSLEDDETGEVQDTCIICNFDYRRFNELTDD